MVKFDIGLLKIIYIFLLIAQVISFFFLLSFKKELDSLKYETIRDIVTRDYEKAKYLIEKTKIMVNWTLVFIVIWIILIGIYLIWVS